MDDVLLNMIVQSEKNLKNYQQLLSEYESKPECFVAFIGAGINFPLRDLPDWKGLFLSLKEKYSLDIEPMKENCPTPSDFSKIYEKIDDLEEFDKAVVELVIPKGTDSSGTSWQLSRAFNKFITTNYHEPVEEAFHSFYIKEDKKLRQYNFLSDYNELSIESLEDSILYLHGNENSGILILRETDYKYFYPSNHNKHTGALILEKKLRFYLDNFNLILFGVNLEDDLRKFIRNYKLSKLKSGITTINNNYWLTKSESFVEKFRKQDKNIGDITDEAIFKRDDFNMLVDNEIENIYKELNIKIIIYQNDHKFNGKICDKLFKIKPDQEQPKYGSYQPEE